MDRRGDPRARRAHHERHQRRRGGDADQSRVHGAARDAAPGARRGRSHASSGAVPRADARGAVLAPGHGNSAERCADDALRRIDGHAGAPIASARRHSAHDGRARHPRDLLPQQRAASLCDSLASRVLLPEQRPHAHGRPPAHGVARLPLHQGRACDALERGGDRRRRRPAARGDGALEPPRR